MKYGFRQLLGVMTLLVMTMTLGQVQADYNNNMECCDYQDQCCAAPCTNWFFCADVLYLVADECGLEGVFGCTGIDVDVVAGVTTTAIHEHDTDPNFSWNPGFRFGVGYKDVSNCGWDVGVFWTHYYGSARQSEKEATNTGHWGLHFDTVDTLFITDLGMGCCNFNLRPFIGIRYARINQNLDALLLTTVRSAVGSSLIESTRHDSQRYWGLGPVFGVEGDWNVGCGFGVYANIAVATLRSSIHSMNDDTNIFTAAVNTRNGSRHMCCCDIALDTGIGFTYEQCLCGYGVLWHAGWERHQYFDQNHMAGSGDLCLEGINFGACVAF